MMAYLDWSKAKDDRIEAQFAAELRDDPAARRGRGVKDIWNRREKDTRQQEKLYSQGENLELEADCIEVRG